MDELTLIGVGTGNPDHLTRQGIAAMRAADVVLIPRKGADMADLADLRRDICATVLGPDTGQPHDTGPHTTRPHAARPHPASPHSTRPHVTQIVEFDMPVRAADGDYLSDVADWHDAIAQAWRAALASAPGARHAALLIWGDPSLYDSALRIAGRLSPAPRLTVVPGITALQALCAAHAIPLNDLGAPFLVTTGRRLRAEGWPAATRTVAVMLDGACAFRTLAPQGVHIWWGAYLGMPHEITLAGPLADLAPRITQTRAAARDRHGWIMDTYLLRRTPEEPPR
ncbi:MAG: precorrin-6A synthase (deacetylating) [Alkalilacustris sp.]